MNEIPQKGFQIGLPESRRRTTFPRRATAAPAVSEPLGRPLRRPRRQAISFPRYDRRRCCGRARERIFRCRDSGRGCQRAISRENYHRFSFRYSMIFSLEDTDVCVSCVCMHYLNKFIYVAAKFLYPCVCKIVFPCLPIVNPNIDGEKRVSRLAGHS